MRSHSPAPAPNSIPTYFLGVSLPILSFLVQVGDPGGGELPGAQCDSDGVQ